MADESLQHCCPLKVILALVIVVVATLVWYLHQMLSSNYPDSQHAKGKQAASRKTGWEISQHLQRCEIGVNFNEWRRPVSTWGPDDKDIKKFECQLDIKQDDWDCATNTVNSVLDMLLFEIKKAANKDLVIEKYVRQGSSREGLKVSKADEFDVLMLFHIKDLDLDIEHLTDANNFILPEFGRLVVVDDITSKNLHARYPWLYGDYIVYDESVGKLCLNSRKLNEKVFISIIQRAANMVQNKVNRETEGDQFHFTIEKFRKNQPAVNIVIKLLQKDKKFPVDKHLAMVKSRIYSIPESAAPLPLFQTETLIDVDIVPGFLLRTEPVPDPTDWTGTMECPKYAVFRWVDENQPAATFYDCAPDIRWRVCTSGYEKHVIDVSRGSTEQSYIITALRIMKWEFQQLKGLGLPPQLVTVLRSYHLKHIAFYCILYLTVLNSAGLSGVKQALAYFLDFLQVVLEEKRLPHFFHDNEFLVHMFPEYEMRGNTLRYDLFTDKPSVSLEQAKLSFRRLKMKQEMCADVLTFPEYAQTFKRYIKEGKYYTVPSRPRIIEGLHLPSLS